MQKATVKTYSSNTELENARALEASKTTYTQRFYILMKLIKTSQMIRNAKVISSPEIPKDSF
jgi:hypothetical protein